MDIPSSHAYWNEIVMKEYCANSSLKATTYVMLPIRLFKEKVFGLAEDYKVLVMSTSTEPKNWIYGCTDQSIFDNIRYW